jgi:transposase
LSRCCGQRWRGCGTFGVEHRRAKTDRLDSELLKRAFLGWLRGEPEHCHMAAIPTLEEEDGKRPNREREKLVGERTRIVNRIRACMVRLGIRGFKSTLRKAAESLAALRTPEAVPVRPNTLAELQRDIARLRFVMDQIKAIETARLERLKRVTKGRTPCNDLPISPCHRHWHRDGRHAGA